jgi:hypothetical protein
MFELNAVFTHRPLRTGALAKILVVALTGTACDAKPSAQPSSLAATQTITCPAVYMTTTRLPANAIVVGPKRATSVSLVSAGLVSGTGADAKNRAVTEEIIDEWDELANGTSIAKLTYDRNQTNMMMHCTYGTNKSKSMFTAQENTVLFLPIPDKQLIACVFKRRGFNSIGATCTSRK